MSYIGFLNMTGTRASALTSRQEYTEAINDFHNSLRLVSSLCKCHVYGYSDNAYVEIEQLDDMIKFFRLLRKRLMGIHRYFSAAVDYGSLKADKVFLEKGKGRDRGFSIKFTAPEVIDLYFNQCHFSGIGISLSKRVVEDLINNKMQDAFCSSIFQRRTEDDVEKELIAVKDISYDSVILENLKYIISDYVITVVLNERAGRYYITPIITMIKALDKSVVLSNTDLDELVELISFQSLPEAFQILNSDHDFSFLFLFALIDFVFSLQEKEGIDSTSICERIVSKSNFLAKELIRQLSSIPPEVISNVHKRDFMSIVYNMKDVATKEIK